MELTGFKRVYNIKNSNPQQSPYLKRKTNLYSLQTGIFYSALRLRQFMVWWQRTGFYRNRIWHRGECRERVVLACDVARFQNIWEMKGKWVFTGRTLVIFVQNV